MKEEQKVEPTTESGNSTKPLVSRRLSDEELKLGYFIKQGQKTTKGIEQLCDESEIASAATSRNQYF